VALQDNRHYPADADPLRGFPRVRLGFFPTPLQGLPNLGRLLGHDRLYIKRDDLTGLSLGGNKTRSLEFLLGDAIARGADVVIAAGGLQSNLCSLTAAACAKVGLKCVLAHNDLPPQALQGNMLLSRIFGAEPVFLGRRTEEERAQAVQEIAADLHKEGRRPYVIENGASTPLGALGYTSAAYELHKQCRGLGISLKHVVIAGAMGGTASGFVFGTALLGHPFHVHVISVEYPAIELRKRMLGLIEGMERLTGLTPGRPAPDCPAASPLTHMVAPEDVMTIYDDYLGGGYAVPTPESLRMVHDLPRLEGIFVENVYAAKTLAGLAGLIWRGIIPSSEPACFIHTGGMAALFAQFSN
jgi:1-aminocyclopropane-1-carboxylate deaminase/D-cysteine desulfhydrase-like pyridoxal-dependent ACC family enzyme